MAYRPRVVPFCTNMVTHIGTRPYRLPHGHPVKPNYPFRPHRNPVHSSPRAGPILQTKPAQDCNGYLHLPWRGDRRLAWVKSSHWEIHGHDLVVPCFISGSNKFIGWMMASRTSNNYEQQAAVSTLANSTSARRLSDSWFVSSKTTFLNFSGGHFTWRQTSSDHLLTTIGMNVWKYAPNSDSQFVLTNNF